MTVFISARAHAEGRSLPRTGRKAERVGPRAAATQNRRGPAHTGDADAVCYAAAHLGGYLPCSRQGRHQHKEKRALPRRPRAWKTDAEWIRVRVDISPGASDGIVKPLGDYPARMGNGGSCQPDG
jgi:hypothetical protein